MTDLANVSDFDQKIADLLASDPAAVLMQMRAHRDVVKSLRDEIAGLKTVKARLEAQVDDIQNNRSQGEKLALLTQQRVADLQKEVAGLEGIIADYACTVCGDSSEPLKCCGRTPPVDDPPDLEVWEVDR